MRLFDGTAEYVRAEDVEVGDTIRDEGEFREVVSVERTEHALFQLRILCADGHGFVAPPQSRVLRKIVAES